ncbi:MAG TPA: hypothetical protein VGG03_15980 [Thermoanaerobaculia bacterium]|jgi:hypothetical protein
MSQRTILAASLAVSTLWTAGMVLVPNAAAPATIRDIATNANDPNNQRDTEPSIAVNPTNPNDIVVVTFAEGWGPGTSAPIWRSTNGGVTWAKSFILPQPVGGTTAPGDQKVDFDANGNLFVAELGRGLSPPRCFVFRQTGAPGNNLTAGAVYGDDQPHLAIGRSAANCLGRVHSPWLDFSVANHRSTVANSMNAGVAITNVVVGLNAQFPNRTTRIALAPNGAAYVIFKLRQGAVQVSLPGSSGNDFENAQFVVRRSDNCGQTWQPAVPVHPAATVQTLFTLNFGDLSRGKVARARSSDAWIAVDPSDGDVYAAYVRRDASNFAQIYVSRSTNQGANWTTQRVTEGTNHSAYPEIAVAANGAIGVLYVDFDNSGPATIFRHRFARSFDNGATWTRQTLQAMDPGPIANAASGFLWGDYEGLTAQGNLFYGVFTGQSINRSVLQLDPIFFTETAIAPQPTPKELCLQECEADRDDCMAGVSQPGNPTPAQCVQMFNACKNQCNSPPPAQQPRLTVKKVLSPANDPGRFNLRVDGTVKASAVGNGGSTGSLVVSAGTHTVSETAAAGTNLANYTTTIGGACASNGSVTVAAGQSKTCTITNVRKASPQNTCAADCKKDRDDCMDTVGEPGMPLGKECAQQYQACLKACPP